VRGAGERCSDVASPVAHEAAAGDRSAGIPVL
jgi:hypothetical protein